MTKNTRRIVQSGILVSAALALSLIERLFPIGAVIPVPGIRLGLANVVTMFALFYMGILPAAAILVVRCVLSSLFSGMTQLLFSLTGGVLALAAMALVRAGYGRVFSIFGVSMAGAVAHNTGQVLVAVLMLGGALISYLPVLLVIGLATGALTAAVAGPIFIKMQKNGLIARFFPESKKHADTRK